LLARHGRLALRTTAALATVVLASGLSLKASTTSTPVATRRAAVTLKPSTAPLRPGRPRAILAAVLCLPFSLTGNGRPRLQCYGLDIHGRVQRLLLLMLLLLLLVVLLLLLVVLLLLLLLGLLLQLQLLGELLLLRLGLLGRSRLEVRDGPRDGLGILVHIKALVDGMRNRLNLSAQVALDVVQVEAIVPVDQVDSQAKVSVPTRATDAVKVGFGVLGEIEVDDDVHGLNVDAAGEKIRTDEVAADAVPEVVKDAVASLLRHLGVAVEARVPEFSDLLGEELDAVRRVAEDDGLVDLQL